jgi:hypothetical protein
MKMDIRYFGKNIFSQLSMANTENISGRLFFEKLWEIKLSNKAVYFILFIICLISTFFRVQDIHHYLNIDEITTSWVIKDSFHDIFTNCWLNNLSPLYYIIVYFSKAWFGLSEAALRIPSIVPGVLSIPLIFAITFELSGSKILSLFAALLSAVDPYLVFFSQEVRPYALIIFFSLLGMYLILCYLKKENKNFYAVFIGLISAIIILLHYTAAVICIVQVSIAGIYFFQTKNLTKKRIVELLIFSVIICIALLPFFNHLHYLFTIREILTNYESHQSQITRFIDIMLPPITGYIIWPLLLSVFFEYWKIAAPYRLKKEKYFNYYFVSLWYFIPLVVFVALATFNIAHMLIIRYLAVIIPVPVIAGMVIIAAYKSKLARLIYLGVLIFLTQFNNIDSVIRNFKWGSYDKHWEWGFYTTKSQFDWKEAVNLINNSDIAPSKVYVMAILTEQQMLNNDSPYDSLLNDYLLSSVNSVYKLDDNYLKKAVLISSVSEIPYEDSDYLLVGRRLQFWFLYIPELKRLSPENASIDVYYKKKL